MPRHNARRCATSPRAMTRYSGMLLILAAAAIVLAICINALLKRRDVSTDLQFSVFRFPWSRNLARNPGLITPKVTIPQSDLEGQNIDSVLNKWGTPSSVLPGQNAPDEVQYRFDYVSADYVVFLFVRNGKVARAMSAKKSDWPAWQHLKRHEGPQRP